VLACAAAALALVSAPTFTDATTGSPDDSPFTWMLAAFTTCSAARLTLPDTRMPASPASMVPSGAIRSMSPGGTSGMGASVAMPAPELGTCGDSFTLPTLSYTRLGGVYTTVVLEPRPALMSPLPTRPDVAAEGGHDARQAQQQAALAYIWMSPSPCVMTPEVAGGTVPCTPTTICAARRQHLDVAAEIGVHARAAEHGDVAACARSDGPRRPSGGTAWRSSRGRAGRSRSAAARGVVVFAATFAQFGEVHLAQEDALLLRRHASKYAGLPRVLRVAAEAVALLSHAASSVS
jgi:hypothetical protein